MESYFIEYAPLLIIVTVFLFKNRIFVTPEQLNKAFAAEHAKCANECNKQYVTKEDIQIERKELLEEVERRFLEKVAFQEFEKRIDANFDTINRRFADSSKRFDKLDENVAGVRESVDHIKEILIKKG